ncbi:Conserved_hypothetical protein [Hexamita inflata]|uniref:Uncharacterized protein n=1 Tax=Hexamita inflata TaxID=28002 RepID=A0AA86TV22_9EUKA|nr:Conserved hypothetical protein [Hexamita inflata]
MTKQMKQVMQHSLYNVKAISTEFNPIFSQNLYPKLESYPQTQDIIPFIPIPEVKQEITPNTANTQNIQEYFRNIDGRLFVCCDYLQQQPNALEMVKQYSAINPQNVHQPFTFNFATSTNTVPRNDFEPPIKSKLGAEKEHYQWSSQAHEIFSIIACGFGVTTVAPKQILSLMNDNQLNRERVASHLQKFRIAIAKNNQIQIENIQNWHLPGNTESQEVIYICERWRDPQFKGFSQQDIQQITAQFLQRQK